MSGLWPQTGGAPCRAKGKSSRRAFGRVPLAYDQARSPGLSFRIALWSAAHKRKGALANVRAALARLHAEPGQLPQLARARRAQADLRAVGQDVRDLRAP